MLGGLELWNVIAGGRFDGWFFECPDTVDGWAAFPSRHYNAP